MSSNGNRLTSGQQPQSYEVYTDGNRTAYERNYDGDRAKHYKQREPLFSEVRVVYEADESGKKVSPRKQSSDSSFSHHHQHFDYGYPSSSPVRCFEYI